MRPKNEEDARRWLQDFASSVGLSYEDVIQAGYDGDFDTGINVDPENYFYTDHESYEERKAGRVAKLEVFWRCWELVTGEVRNSEYEGQVPFSCSC